MSLADPYDMLQDVCDREFGFQPLNFSIKPVHVANGLARALTQRSYKTDALAHTLRRYVVKQNLGVDQERHPNSEILQKYGTAFDALQGSVPDRQRLNSLRALLLDVLGADGEARAKLLAAVRAYESLMHGLRKHYDTIFEVVGSDVDELVEMLLLMDMVVIKGETRVFALLSPVHPLFLWHYARPY